MLVISLVVSALLLGLANLAAYRSRHAGGWIISVSLAFLIAPLFLFCFLPAVAMQSLGMVAAAGAWRASAGGLRSSWHSRARPLCSPTGSRGRSS